MKTCAAFAFRGYTSKLVMLYQIYCDLQVSVTHHEKVEFDDPLRVHAENVADSDGWHFTSTSRRNSNEAGLFSAKEWTVFSCSLVQKFSCNNKIPISPVSCLFANIFFKI